MLEQKAEETGKLPELLQEDYVDPAYVYLVEIFWDLRKRAGGPMGPNPIGWSDLRAYGEVTGVKLTSWEARIILLMDETYLTTWKPKKNDD